MKRTVASCGLAAVLIAGCSGPSEADETACLLYVAAENDITSAMNLWIIDGSAQGGTDLTRQRGAERLSRISEAADSATGELRVLLNEQARLWADSGSSEDAALAFYMQQPHVFDMCRDLGVDFELIEPVDG